MGLTDKQREMVREEANVSQSSNQCLQPKKEGGAIVYCTERSGHAGPHRTQWDENFEDTATTEELLKHIERRLLGKRRVETRNN